MNVLRAPGLLVVSLVFTFSSPSLATAEDKVERLSIVDRAIEHHGGALSSGSVTELETCSLSGCSSVRATVDGGLFEYVVRGKVRDAERRVRATNDEVELWLDGRPVPVAGHEAQAMRDWAMARVYFAFLPYRLNDPGVWKEDLGLETWEGRDLHKVKVSFTPESSTHADDEYLYWFDPETAELVQFAYSYSTSNEGLRFRRLFNARRVGGILFADQENWGVEGPGLSVDLMTPEYVAGLRRVSTVELRNVSVGPLPR